MCASASLTAAASLPVRISPSSPATSGTSPSGRRRSFSKPRASRSGELLTPLPPLPDCVFVICKPQFSISTPELFRKLDQVSLRRHPDTAGIVSALERSNLGDICRRMYNVFEDVNDRRMRTVTAIKNVLIDHGALGAVMTGTGSAVFGIFTDKAAAEAARDELKKDYGFCCLAGGVRALT